MQNLRLKAKNTIKSSVIIQNTKLKIPKYQNKNTKNTKPNSKYGIWSYFDILYFQEKS